MLAQMLQLARQIVGVAGALPVSVGTPIRSARSQIQFDRQFEVMHALRIAQHNIQFAQRSSVLPNGQIRPQQLDARRLLQGELPEAFVIHPQTLAARSR